MATLNVTKVVSSLPGTLAANTVYMVRVGTGYDQYVTNNSGTIVAYKLNSTPQGANSTSLDTLTGAADTFAYFSGVATMTTAPFTATGRALVAATDAPGARTALGLGNVDNTSDLNKPVSTATTTALGNKLDTTGTAAAATKLATARTINGVAFDGTANITIASSDSTKLPLDGSGVMTGPINEAPIQSATAAATVNVTNATANTVSMSGSTTITAFTSAASGVTRRVIFTAAVTLTHSTNFYLPGAANIVAAVNDIAEFVSLGGGAWKCYNYMKANGQPAKGALVAFIDNLATTGANGAVYASQFTSTATSTDADIVLTPKGNGALQAQLADTSATGGNKRGIRAVDFQQVRTAATQVAGGAYCVVVGGSGNTANNTYSFVGGGLSNSATSTYAGVVAGTGNVASGTQSFIGGGGGNTASNTYSAIIGGQNNTASGSNSTGLGGIWGLDRGMSACMFRSSGAFSAFGDSQWRSATVQATLSGAGPIVLTVGGQAMSALNVFVLPNNSSFMVDAQVIARDSTGATAAWTVSFAVKRGAAANTTVIVGTPVITLVGGDSGSGANWTVTPIANTTYGAVTVSVAMTSGGAASGYATANITTVEVVGP